MPSEQINTFLEKLDSIEKQRLRRNKMTDLMGRLDESVFLQFYRLDFEGVIGLRWFRKRVLFQPSIDQTESKFGWPSRIESTYFIM